MRYNKLDLNLLVALDALLTECNISRAGERVHLSQPAMSNALSRLRSYFDDELLVPVGRHMERTPRAEVLREAVRDVLVRIETSVATQPEFDSRDTDRTFKLSVSDYSMEVLIPHALAIADAMGSRAKLHLRPQSSNPARDLERGEADLLLIPDEWCSAEHPSRVLFDDELVCVVWRESRHARQGISMESYAAAGHVAMQPIEINEPAFEQWIQAGVGVPRDVRAAASSFAVLPFLVVGSELIATMHARLARLVEPALPIKRMAVPFPLPPIHQAMQWHKYRDLDPGLIWLRHILDEAAKRL
jgi:LysR family transcriptional regulator, nod-box dependent transcriptional activator